MLRRITTLLLVCIISLGICTACSQEEVIAPATSEIIAVPSASEPIVTESPTVEPLTAEGFEDLDDLWAVRGIFYKSNLIDIYDNDALRDLYDSYYLNFFEDGTFHYMGLFNYRGKYTRREDGTFLLKTESVFTYDMTSQGLVEKEATNSTPKPYLLTLLDENTFLLNDFDPIMGKASVDSTDYVFVRNGKESVYLSTNKAKINGSSEKPSTSKNEPTNKYTPSVPESASKPSINTGTVTAGKRNALQSAKNYLSVIPFSYSGLVEQLEFEGYSYSEATYAADNCGADWYEQAVKKAEDYLEVMAFSRSGLIEQLEFEGFTYDQAVYGVNKAY